jgi:hypothetical protein
VSADHDHQHEGGPDELGSRLARANPFEPGEPSVERAHFERALRDTILAEHPQTKRPVFSRRRVVALGVSVVLVASAGVSVAVLTREAPPAVKAAAKLDPATIPPALRPVAGTDPRLLVEYERGGQRWQVWGSETVKGTDLVHLVRPGTPAPSVASAGCPPPDGSLRVCSVSFGLPKQTVVGRVGPGVASVETVGLDGTRTRAVLDDGFFLSVADTGTAGMADRVEALDGAGEVVLQERVTILDDNGNVVRP